MYCVYDSIQLSTMLFGKLKLLHDIEKIVLFVSHEE